jgi:hypothetical protein
MLYIPSLCLCFSLRIATSPLLQACACRGMARAMRDRTTLVLPPAIEWADAVHLARRAAAGSDAELVLLRGCGGERRIRLGQIRRLRECGAPLQVVGDTDVRVALVYGALWHDSDGELHEWRDDCVTSYRFCELSSAAPARLPQSAAALAACIGALAASPAFAQGVLAADDAVAVLRAIARGAAPWCRSVCVLAALSDALHAAGVPRGA